MNDGFGGGRAFVGVEENLEMVGLIPGKARSLGRQGNEGRVTNCDCVLEGVVVGAPETSGIEEEQFARFDQDAMHDAEGAEAHEGGVEQRVVSYEIRPYAFGKGCLHDGSGFALEVDVPAWCGNEMQAHYHFLHGAELICAAMRTGGYRARDGLAVIGTASLNG
ncbi:MAG: hypothetical protein NTAFB09_07950 [Nitrosospira sp.]